MRETAQDPIWSLRTPPEALRWLSQTNPQMDLQKLFALGIVRLRSISNLTTMQQRVAERRYRNNEDYRNLKRAAIALPGSKNFA